MKSRRAGRSTRGTGVYAVGHEVYVTEIEAAGDVYRIRRALSKTWFDPAYPAPPLTQFAESVRAICMTYGLTRDAVGMTYAKETCFCYEKSFPALSEKETAAAAAWDLELNCPYPEGRFWGGYCPMPDGTIRIAAVDEAHGADMVARLEALGMTVSALTLLSEDLSFAEEEGAVLLQGIRCSLLPSAAESLWPEGQIASLYAALSTLHPMADTVHFLPEHAGKRKRDWQAMGKGVLCVWLTALLFLYLLNGWRIHRMEERLAEVNLAWEMKRAVGEQMEKWQALQGENEKRDDVLDHLSAERTSWSYIFYTLGALTVPNVYLTSVDMKEDRALYCQGVAVSYEDLVAFLEVLEENRSFFRERPRLEHFEKGEPQGITFSLRLRF